MCHVKIRDFVRSQFRLTLVILKRITANVTPHSATSLFRPTECSTPFVCVHFKHPVTNICWPRKFSPPPPPFYSAPFALLYCTRSGRGSNCHVVTWSPACPDYHAPRRSRFGHTLPYFSDILAACNAFWEVTIKCSSGFLPNLLPTDVLSNAVSEASSGSLSPQQFNYSWHY